MTTTPVGDAPNRRASDYCPACDNPWDECECIDRARLLDDEQEEREQWFSEDEGPFLPDDAA